MDWGSITQLIVTFLFGGGILTFVTLKDKKTEAILSNMQKVIDEQREMMKHKKEMYESILAEKNAEIAELHANESKAEEKIERKDEKIEELYKINSGLRRILDEANTAKAVAEILVCDIIGCGKRNPPLNSKAPSCKDCSHSELIQEQESYEKIR